MMARRLDLCVHEGSETVGDVTAVREDMNTAWRARERLGGGSHLRTLGGLPGAVDGARGTQGRMVRKNSPAGSGPSGRFAASSVGGHPDDRVVRYYVWEILGLEHLGADRPAEVPVGNVARVAQRVGRIGEKGWTSGKARAEVDEMGPVGNVGAAAWTAGRPAPPVVSDLGCIH